MKPLWAPWRMQYLVQKKKTRGCIFCALLKAGNDRKNLIIWRRKEVYVVLNKYPYNNGHVMVIPHFHAANLPDIPRQALKDMWLTTKDVVRGLTSVYKPDGFNVGMNLGNAGGAGIAEHLHLHVIPRWMGDTNFMPILCETKALPQHLLASFDQLHEYFRRL